MIHCYCIKEIIFSFRLSMLNTNLHTCQLYIHSHKNICVGSLVQWLWCFITTKRPLFHGVVILISWYCLKFTYLEQAMKWLSCLLRRRKCHFNFSIGAEQNSMRISMLIYCTNINLYLQISNPKRYVVWNYQ